MTINRRSFLGLLGGVAALPLTKMGGTPIPEYQVGTFGPDLRVIEGYDYSKVATEVLLDAMKYGTGYYKKTEDGHIERVPVKEAMIIHDTFAVTFENEVASLTNEVPRIAPAPETLRLRRPTPFQV